MKKILSFCLALCFLFLSFSLCACRERTEDGTEKTVTLIVVGNGGYEKTHVIRTARAYLADALLDEKIVEGEMSTYGLYITAVDGLIADYSTDGSWWAVYEGDTMSMNGVSQIELTDGATYKLVYTIG